MDSNNELRESDIKNCACYYFDEKYYENILVYNISYKNFTDKPLAY